jgi:hypothetical protein
MASLTTQVYVDNVKAILWRLARFRSRCASFPRKQQRQTWLAAGTGRSTYSVSIEHKLFIYALVRLNVPFYVNRRRTGSTVVVLDVPRLREAISSVDLDAFLTKLYYDLASMQFRLRIPDCYPDEVCRELLAAAQQVEEV